MAGNKQKKTSHAQAVEELLKKVTAGFQSDQVKATLADYIRLVQLQRELEEDQPDQITVTWVDPETDKDA
jgi:hypothetical protein